MKTLLTLFGKERGGLETEIRQADNPNQVVRLVQNKLDTLERSYIGALNVRQVRLVKFFLDTLRQSVATLTEANDASTELESGVVYQTPLTSNSLILKLLQVLTTISIFISLFSVAQDDPGAWMTVLLMFLLVGLEVVIQLDRTNRDRTLTQPIQTIQPQVQVDGKLLLDNLAEALNTIDVAVAQAEAVPKLGSSGVEDMSEILDFLQKLWGASLLGHPQMTIELTKLIPQILLEQGIQVQNYQPNVGSREYFDFEPSIDSSSQEYITLVPALLKGDRVLRRGRVIEPVPAKN